MQKFYIVIFYIIILIQSGCAARVYFRSDQAIKNSFDKNATIFLKADETLSIEEANFMVLLEEEIKRSGLKLTDELFIADYVLSFSLSEPIFFGQSFEYEPILPIPYFGQEGPIYFGPVSYIYSYPQLKINVTIFMKDNFLNKPRIPLWEASLLVKKEVYQEHTQELIRIIIIHMGKRFDGDIKV